MSNGSNPAAKPFREMTLGDLLALVGSSGGLAGWAAIAMIFAQMQGCQLPGRIIPDPPTPVKPPQKADAPAAIGRLSMGNVGCTGTIIGPVKDDDKEISILTAAHCLKVGVTGTMLLKDGRKIAFKCVSRNEKADCAWLTAPRPGGYVPFALLAQELPEKGSPVWHQGYGIDQPGNIEKGTFQGVTSDGAQCQFSISVSSGDSGGAIVLTEDGKVISPVCCTTRLSGPGTVYGSTPQNADAIRPGRVVSVSDEEVYRPIIILPDPRWAEPPAG